MFLWLAKKVVIYGALEPIRKSDDHGVPPTGAPYMGSTHGRLILILVVASANSIFFIEGRFLIICQPIMNTQKAQPFFKKRFYWVNVMLFSGFSDFHGS
jgi:hypothetical protein